MNARLLALASFASVALASTAAFAQYAPPPPPPPGYGAPMYAPPAPPRPFPDRSGFTIGFGIGGGWLSSDSLDEFGETSSSIGIDMRVGAALRQNLLLQLEVSGTAQEHEYAERTQLNFYGFSLTAYLHPRIFVVGGLGTSVLVFGDVDGSDDDDFDDKPTRAAAVDLYRQQDSEWSGALLLGAGVDVYQSNYFGVTLEVRSVLTSFDDVNDGESVAATNVMLGLQWW